MSAVCQGDEAAFAQLMHRHIDSLYSYAQRLLRSSSGADDLVQETWLAVWRRANTFKPNQVKLTTWLHRILHNKYIDGMRRNRLILDEAVVNQQAADEHPPAEVERAQQLEQLQTQIALLPDNQKVAILLSHQQAMSNQQIATVMGQSVRAVESLLARARRTLKKSLREAT